MPFQKQVEDDEILEGFERDDLGRRLFTYHEVAEAATDKITAEAVRQRLEKMEGDEVESVEMGGVKFWKLPGEQVFIEPRVGVSTPQMNPRVRQVGGVLIGLSILVAVVANMIPSAVALAASLGSAGAALVAVSYLPRMMESDETENWTSA